MPHRKHIAQDKYIKGKTLDIGFVEFPNRISKNLYGIDIVSKPVPNKNYIETKQVDLNISPIPYTDGFFETVLIGDVIEHVTNPLMLLCEANRVLKPGGTLIVSTPNPYYYWKFMQNLLVNFTFMHAVQEGHFTTFTRINMRNILERTGFKLTRELGNFFSVIVLKWTFHWVRFPFLTYQITYIAEKTGEPQHYIVSKPYGEGRIRVQTSLVAKE
ncbi:MAG: Methyltransferase type 11 [Candidatus Peribacteria bacterium]|nr:Methyltransferase type 11 [Candidatus Peribacteria bacterium]